MQVLKKAYVNPLARRDALSQFFTRCVAQQQQITSLPPTFHQNTVCKCQTPRTRSHFSVAWYLLHYIILSIRRSSPTEITAAEQSYIISTNTCSALQDSTFHPHILSAFCKPKTQLSCSIRTRSHSV